MDQNSLTQLTHLQAKTFMLRINKKYINKMLL